MTTTPTPPEASDPIASNASTDKTPHPADWAETTLEKLLLSTLVEQRRARRWGIFFKLSTLILVVVYLAGAVFFTARESAEPSSSQKHVALVSLRGQIDDHGKASASKINAALRSAFKNPASIGVILRINSPGGSPVQSAMIYDEIKRLRVKYPDKPLYAVVEDLCASGGYYVAAAADSIYVNPSSLIGSIGVLMNGFGFTHSLEKLGVERRLITAGDNKGFLDPFSPLKPTERAHAERLLQQIHQQFINAVKNGRGKRLGDDPRLFSGLVWTGEEGIRLGLADALGDMRKVARDVLHNETIEDYSRAQETWFERLNEQLGTQVADRLAYLLSEQAAWRLH